MAGAKAFCCKLFRSEDAGANWGNISGITTVNKPEGTRAEIDVTDLCSPAKEYELDVPDNGNISFPINFAGNDAVHQQLFADEASGVLRDWLLEFPEPNSGDPATVTTFAFKGFVTSIGLTAAAGGKQDMTLNIRVSGANIVAHGATAQV